MNAEVKIIRNAPPPTPDCRGRRPVYPWDDISVGDAFDVPAPADERASDGKHPVHNRVTGAASTRNLREKVNGSGVKFVVRYLRGENVVRCWKVAA